MLQPLAQGSGLVDGETGENASDTVEERKDRKKHPREIECILRREFAIVLFTDVGGKQLLSTDIVSSEDPVNGLL